MGRVSTCPKNCKTIDLRGAQVNDPVQTYHQKAYTFPDFSSPMSLRNIEDHNNSFIKGRDKYMDQLHHIALALKDEVWRPQSCNGDPDYDIGYLIIVGYRNPFYPL